MCLGTETDVGESVPPQTGHGTPRSARSSSFSKSTPRGLAVDLATTGVGGRVALIGDGATPTRARRSGAIGRSRRAGTSPHVPLVFSVRGGTGSRRGAADASA